MKEVGGREISWYLLKYPYMRMLIRNKENNKGGYDTHTLKSKIRSCTMMPLVVSTASILVLFSQAISASSFSLSDRPTLKYGTAWKKERTADLVYQAILNGFRHVDTACQPRHYNEAGVGEGWTKAVRELGLKREDIWLQTKFSSLDAQDPEDTPYDRSAPIEDRVRQSLAVSLENLQTDYLDSWVMHGPENNWDDNFKVWATMEEGVDQGKVKQLGISNWYRLEDIQWLYDHARVKPKVRLILDGLCMLIHHRYFISK